MSDWPPREDDPFAALGRPVLAPRRRARPIFHDHAGRMIWSAGSAECSGCGQRWELSWKENVDGSVTCRWRPVYDD